jgi:hypothetical protein
MAWLTTVRPDGQPISVPVWFLVREDETILRRPRLGTGEHRAGQPGFAARLKPQGSRVR